MKIGIAVGQKGKTMDDLISRRAAIDTLLFGKEMLSRALDDMDVVDTEREKYSWGLGLIESNIYDIEELPSAQQWIPCSERLPKLDNSYPNSKEYLTQWDDGRIDKTRYSNVNIFWQNEITEPYWKGEQCSKVIAWMPLPEPYKGEES